MVTARIENARRSKGYRFSIYKSAEECHGLYYPPGSSASIYYEGEGQDLRIRLLFRDIRDAEDFQTNLNCFAQNHSHFAEKLKMDKAIPAVNVAESIERVLRTDYNSSDNTDSPELSLKDVLSNSESVVSLSQDPSCTLQALENPRIIASMGSKWYRCHMIPHAAADPLKSNPNNFIYGSWYFHQQFDGLNTPHGIGLAISLDPLLPREEEVMVKDSYEKRWRVYVLIHFDDADISRLFEVMFKEGTEKQGDLRYRTFIHVRDHIVFRDCIVKKLQDQKSKSPWVASLGIV